MYALVIRPFGALTLYQLINQATGEQAEVLAMGGALQGLLLGSHGRNHTILHTPATYEEYQSWGKRGFYGAKLFPFPGRVASGHYRWGKASTYQLDLNDGPRANAVHGLVYNQLFTVVKQECTGSYALLALNYQASSSLPGYPFDFDLIITYQLDSNGLSCSTQVTNRGTKPMPVGDGWHPYLLTEAGAAATKLRFASRAELLVGADLLPTGEHQSNERFASWAAIGPPGALHQCYSLKSETGVHRTWLHDPARQLTTEVWQETGPDGYNYLQLYVPADRRSVAVEPCTCPSNSFNTGIGCIRLAPGQTKQWRMGLRLVSNKELETDTHGQLAA